MNEHVRRAVTKEYGARMSCCPSKENTIVVAGCRCVLCCALGLCAWMVPGTTGKCEGALLNVHDRGVTCNSFDEAPLLPA